MDETSLSFILCPEGFQKSLANDLPKGFPLNACAVLFKHPPGWIPMNRATPQMRNFASRLIACETAGKQSSGTKAPAGFRVCEKLRPQLATFMGSAGFHALLARALAVANAENSGLRSLHLKADGSLGSSGEPAAPADPEKVAEAGMILVAQLLSLLVAFIGEDLTLRMVREVWPELPLNASDLIKGDENEKTK